MMGNERGRRVLAGAVRGAAHGVAATVVMSGWMLLARRLGLMSRLPPEKLTAILLRRLGVRPRTPLLEAATLAGHFSYGAALGALFQSATDRLPGPAALKGALFGAAVWGVSYAGWVPALELMPPPHRDRPGRQASTLAAHLIYGAVLGGLAARYT
jgi:hypothetical protein